MNRCLKTSLLTFLACLWPTGEARADDACMLAPVGQVSNFLPVSGRFGKNRPGGAANHGGNPVPHTHDGLDFSTGGKNAPVYATADATVTLAQFLKGAGNTIRARRDDGSIMEYYHLDSFDSKVQPGARIKAGQQIGISGKTGVSQVHLHFVYARPTASGQRAVNFPERASLYKGAFNPGQLPNALTNNKPGVGFRTDPSPFFCDTFKIQNDGLYPYLTDNTKGQHQVLFGNVPPGGAQPNVEHDDAQVAAANADAVQAAAAGKTPEKWLADTDSFGALPSPPTGDYDSISPLEMVLTESQRRLADSTWQENLLVISTRALYVDYLRAIGARNFIAYSIQQKQEKIEALMALYLSLKLKNQQQPTQGAAANAMGRSVNSAVQ